MDELRRLGVLSWHLHTGDDMQQDPQLAAIRKARGYSYQVICSRFTDLLHQARRDSP